jgi:uncharacterized protein (DUF362 family)
MLAALSGGPTLCKGRNCTMSGLNRRQFIRRVLAVSTVGAALSACGSRQSPPKAVSPAATAVPATVMDAPAPTKTPAAPAKATASTQVKDSPTAAPAATEALPATVAPAPTAAKAAPGLVVAHGSDPAEITRRAVAALGGIERFVKPGANVIIKPNTCVAYRGPEYAATTNPQVVAALVALCMGAGAKQVRVMDFPFGGTPQASYAKSGIADAVKAAGGQMEVMNTLKYRQTPVPQGKAIKKYAFYGDILDADVLINVPIAKHHSAAGLTLGMKNMMGVVLDRNTMHSRGLHQSIADVNTVVKAQLTIVDAVRILLANGPTGGSLDDVKKMDTIIASTDVVAADAYATTLFGMTGKDIDYIRLGAEMGLGEMDLSKVKIEQISL